MYANWFFKLDRNVMYYQLTVDQYNTIISEQGEGALSSFHFDSDDKIYYATDITDEEETMLLEDYEWLVFDYIYTSTQHTHGG